MDMQAYIQNSYDEMISLVRDLCRILAPSHKEHERARFCKEWLEKNGADGVYIDDALNVIFPLNCDGKDKLTVFVAHTDTVFPDETPMPFSEDEEKIHCPGVGDDTASVAVLLMCARFFVQNKIASDEGIMFVCNSCEEGLGNLKGTRKLFEDFEGRIENFVSFDSGDLNVVADRCVGSHRYEVEVLTKGGHSFSAFGNKNAICELSNIIRKIYEIEVPEKTATKTTYNVGCVDGGTSVNTIAQRAKMLCEYRSDDKEALDEMKAKFEKIFDEARNEEVEVSTAMIGERPCADIEKYRLEKLRKIVDDVIGEVTGKKVCYVHSSTDCNIPLSLGIAAICIGVFNGGGAHTREEWIEKKSLIKGLEIAIKVMLKLI